MNRSVSLLVEWTFAISIIVFIIYAYWFTTEYGYYPPPFFYDASDTFMDWYNPAYWANNPGAYDTWNTLYPPFSFIFLKIFSIGACYDSASVSFLSARSARDGCDFVGLLTLAAIFFLNLTIITLVMWRNDRRTAIPRIIALAVGLPMLHGFERGNLIVVTFTCFVLGFGPLLKTARLRWLAVAMAINFKIYLIATIFPLLLKRKWRWVEGALGYTIGLYAASALLLGDGSPLALYENIASAAAGGNDTDSLLTGWFAATYTPFITILNSTIIPIKYFLGSDPVDLLLMILPLMQRGGQLLIVAAAIGAFLRPEAVKTIHLVNLGLLLALITSEAGAYTVTMVGFCILLEPWSGKARSAMLLCFYLLCLPVDYTIDILGQLVFDSYVGGTTVVIDAALTAGPFIRPLLFTIIAYAWALMILDAVRRDFASGEASARTRFRGELFAPAPVPAPERRPAE